MNLTDPPSSAIVLERTIEPAFYHYSNRRLLKSNMEIDSTENSPVPSSSPESSVGSSRGTTPDIPDTQDRCYITQDEGMRTEGTTVKNICCIGAGYVGEFFNFQSSCTEMNSYIKILSFWQTSGVHCACESPG